MCTPDRFKAGPYEIQVFLQTFGGKIAGDPKGKGSGKGSAPGIMEYENITNTKEGKKIIQIIKDLS
jgi:hypothetical protein